MEAETYDELGQGDMQGRYPELWEKVRGQDQTP
jgi:hypothetical protein